MRIPQLALALIAAALGAPLLAAPAGVGNLGDSLLDAELAKRLSPPAKQQAKPIEDRLLPDQEMLKRLFDGDTGAAGEDVGESPLAGVVNGMRQAEAFLRDEAGDKQAVPVQREVVAQLEQLIAKMEKQCQGGQCKKKGDQQKKQASKRSQPKEGQCDKPGECDKEGQCDKPGQKPGKQANKAGTTKLGGAPDAQTPEQQQELMKAAWGHLPERMRERMLQGAGGEFLPEYREELQEYYRKLAERTAPESP
ncbi:hypothetical protein MalM25_18310 [Planctomycetes bacterium MalM25]|nr:hypothetical protein MalM25_18310 [Planctomycetes bacterium MalM25]